MACNQQSSSQARILLLLILTHSLTQTDSIVAYASLSKEAVSYKNVVRNLKAMAFILWGC